MTSKQLERRTGLYTEAVRRYCINAYWVVMARGTSDYQYRMDTFTRALARELNLDYDSAFEPALLLLKHHVLRRRSTLSVWAIPIAVTAIAIVVWLYLP